MNERWTALQREAMLAAEHIAAGATAIGRANYAQQAYYHQAFFSLSIGFERSAKIAIAVDHALDHDGVFPPSKELKAYSHNLKELMSRVGDIGKKHGVGEARPTSPIHLAMIEVLSEFATNGTRYYNLEILAGEGGEGKPTDPIMAWANTVSAAILNEHVRKGSRRRVEENARRVSELMSTFALIRHQSEKGTAMTAEEASTETGTRELVAPWERMYALQVGRFVASVLRALAHAAQEAGLHDVPYFPDMFAIFINEDATFRKRPTWSIYR